MDNKEIIYSEDQYRANAVQAAVDYIQKKKDEGIQFLDAIAYFGMFFAGGVIGYFLHYLFSLKGVY